MQKKKKEMRKGLDEAKRKQNELMEEKKKDIREMQVMMQRMKVRA
jgi:hypothetical protein